MSKVAWVLIAAVVAFAPAAAHAEADVPAATNLSPPSAASKASFFRLFGIGAATTLLVTPASMALGAYLGTLSNNLYLALIPSLLIVALVPPLVVVLVEHALGNRLWGAGTFKMGWALVAGFVLQLGLVVACALLGLPGTTVPGIAIFTAIDIVILGGATSGIMWVTKVEPMATVASRSEAAHGSAGSEEFPRAPAAALATVRF